jgi:hypothetical protein
MRTPSNKIEEVDILASRLEGMAFAAGNDSQMRWTLERAAYWLNQMTVCGAGFVNCLGGPSCSSDHKPSCSSDHK